MFSMRYVNMFGFFYYFVSTGVLFLLFVLFCFMRWF